MPTVKFHVFNPKAVEEMFPHVCLSKVSAFDGPQFWALNHGAVMECGHCGMRFDTPALHYRPNPIWRKPYAHEQR